MFNNNNDNPIKWKGRTYNEIVSIFKRNKNKNVSTQNTFLPNPCKIYRRELPIITYSFSDLQTNSGNDSTTLQQIETPGSTIRYLSTLGDYCDNSPPLSNSWAIQKPYSSPIDTTLKECDTNNTIINSIRRVRSCGMNPEKPTFVSTSKISTKYYTNECQYLKSTFNDNCTIYNPNNQQFSQQGAVSYSNYVLRKNFDINRANNQITSATYNVPLLYAESIKNAIGDTGSLCSNFIDY